MIYLKKKPVSRADIRESSREFSSTYNALKKIEREFLIEMFSENYPYTEYLIRWNSVIDSKYKWIMIDKKYFSKMYAPKKLEGFMVMQWLRKKFGLLSEVETGI